MRNFDLRFVSQALFVCLLVALPLADRPETVYVCEAGDDSFLGRYDAKESAGSSRVFVNANSRGIFRHSGFWYLGDVSDWPPDTHYRCVMDDRCRSDGDTPALEGYQPTQRNGIHPPPVISITPCVNLGNAHQEL